MMKACTDPLNGKQNWGVREEIGRAGNSQIRGHEANTLRLLTQGSPDSNCKSSSCHTVVAKQATAQGKIPEALL